MAVTRRPASAVFAMLLGIVAALAVTAPARASSSYVGANGAESRCAGKSLSCLYYSAYTSAYWGTYSSDSDLGNNYFVSGTGSGAGQKVRNNSARMSCYLGVPYQCESFYSPGYTGNDDWMFAGQIGQLYYTSNDGASMRTS